MGLQRTILPPALPALLLATGACGASGGPEPTAGRRSVVIPGRPNVLLVTLDTTRADHLSCYGYFRETTPDLDALASESVVFERCLAPMSTTLPTHTSLFTGVWPEEHGVLSNIRENMVYERDPELVTLAEVFADAGYDTAAFVSAFPLRPEVQLTDGFASYDAPDPGRRERSAETTTLRALAWLDQPREAPFFLWVHYFDPHNPHRTPDRDFRVHQTDRALREWLAERSVASSSYRHVIKRTEKGRAVDLLKDANGYDDELLYMDHHLGRILEEVRGSSWDETIVIVVGDHGEGLNQHREAGHGFAWDEQLRVPLILRAPGLAARREGALVSVVDVGPTLLGMLELPGEERFLERSRGVDVLDAAYRTRPLLGQSSQRAARTGFREDVAITTQDWKYMRRSDGGEALYDLQRDPHELHDVAVLHPELVDELRRTADRLLEEQRGRGGGSRRAATRAETEALRRLGYGGDDGADGDGNGEGDDGH